MGFIYEHWDKFASLKTELSIPWISPSLAELIIAPQSVARPLIIYLHFDMATNCTLGDLELDV